MRSLQHAKELARATRQGFASDNTSLLAALREHFAAHYQIETMAVPAGIIDGSRAEVSPNEGVINYDERLDRKPHDLLWTLAHELGHLVLHKRLTAHDDKTPDALLGSAYLNDGAAALTRYSRKAREEAEANAFANEFLCPANSLLLDWLHDSNATTHSLANKYALPVNLICVQLAEGLFQSLFSPLKSESDNKTASNKGIEAATDASKSATDRPLIKVNDRQLAAATFTGAPALVTAGPGTGKTATLIRRIEYLLAEHNAQPDQLLVLTFSNDATEELRERVAKRFGDDTANEIEIATFHGFGMSFLHTHALGLSGEFTLLDETGQEELINQLLGSLDIPALLNLRDLEETVKRLTRHFNFIKDRVLNDQPITPQSLATEIDTWSVNGAETNDVQKTRELLSAFVAYESAKEAVPAVDFADLISLPIRVLSQQPKLVEAIREKYRWVMVDEYQDVSRTVALLLRLLCGPGNPPWVVGDMRQAIYRFRGAAPENVRDFHHDFPNAQIFELDINYRSCPEIVNAANQLGDLLAAEEPALNEVKWQAGSQQTNCSEPTVAIAHVNSDEAEATGIANQVKDWLAQGIHPSEIAVLARRNLDVRNIVLSLGAQGIRATTGGLLTAEGAAGDLVAIVTLPDEPVASLPRLVYALGRSRFEPTQLNALIQDWLTALRDKVDNENWSQKDDLHSFETELKRILAVLQNERLTSDGFAMLCVFLFDASDYLRKVFAMEVGAQRTLALSEIISTLSRAASYRFAHPAIAPQLARVGFAQQLRGKLTASSPSLAVPQADRDAVQVMTCHASKGLEFPCVIVAGQTLGQAHEQWWLPTSLQPAASDERAQADALMFVGITRAQRAVVISCAESKSGSERARRRNVTPLLDQWQTQHNIMELRWDTRAAINEQISLSSIWGGSLRRNLAARTLDEKTCAVKTYLEDFLGTRFPQIELPQYASFYHALRLTCEDLIKTAQTDARHATENEAGAFFSQRFPRQKHFEHPHYSIYQRYGVFFARRFANAYEPRAKAIEFIEPVLHKEGLLPLRFDLIALFKANDGATHAYLFRPESLSQSTSKNTPDELLWSGLDTSQRSAFLILKYTFPEVKPYVFSAQDGMIYRYNWNKKAENMQIEQQRLQTRWQSFGQALFSARLNEHVCNRCPVRLACPHWMKATI